MNHIGNTPLHLAAQYGNLEMVNALLRKKGADIDAQNKSGDTPSKHGDIFKQHDIVSELISKGADTNIPDKNGWTPL